MATPLPGSIPTSVNTVEKLMIYAATLYNKVALGKRYSERSDVDIRQFCQLSVDDVYSEENGSSHFLLMRAAVPLNSDYQINAEKIWDTAPGLAGSISLPSGFTD